MYKSNSNYDKIYASSKRAYEKAKRDFVDAPYLKENKELAERYELIKKTNNRKEGTLYHFYRAINLLCMRFPEKKFLDITEVEFMRFFDELANMKYVKRESRDSKVVEWCIEKGSIDAIEVSKKLEISSTYSRAILRRIVAELDGFKIEKKGKNLSIIATPDAKLKVSGRTSRFSDTTLMGIKTQIKQFYKFLDGGDSVPKQLKFLEIRPIASKIDESQIYTEEEIMKIIRVAKHLRDKTIISVLAESGARAGELIGLDVGKVTRDKYSYIISVDGKTGKRPIRLVTSIPYLAAWLAIHPYKENPEAPLWISLSPNRKGDGRIGRGALIRIVKKFGKAAGINKRHHPHLYRHFSATHNSKKFTDAEMRLYFGWSKSSNMPSVYTHLSHKDLDNKILAEHDFIDYNKKEKSVLSPVKCVSCENLIPPDYKFCGKCGTAKSQKVLMEQMVKDEKENDFMNQVTMKYQQLKEQGLSTEEIVKKLNS